jgi:hypothetical protein
LDGGGTKIWMIDVLMDYWIPFVRLFQANKTIWNTKELHWGEALPLI